MRRSSKKNRQVSEQDGAQLGNFSIFEFYVRNNHVFVDLKKTFDSVWHAALWATVRLHNINENLIRIIECLHNKVTMAASLQ